MTLTVLKYEIVDSVAVITMDHPPVNAVFPQENLYERSLDYATRLARQATGAIARIKTCVNIGIREGFARGLATESAAFRENIVSPDAREGVNAFLAGRKPVFSG